MNAIVYAAKSTEDKHGSIPTQTQDGRAMAAREGWEIVGEYTDEAASAWHGDRGPGLAAAIAHAERIAPCVIVVQHSDRLARGDGRAARHLGELYFWALKANVELRSVQDDSTFTNPLLTFAMGERNAEDSRRKSLAVAAGMQRRAAAGKPAGGIRPLGYRHDDGTLQVVNSERETVRRIFSEFLAGRNLSEIARGLLADRIPTVRGSLWRQSTVRSVLVNPLYIGKVRHRDTVYDGHHAPLIDPETWERVQTILAARPSRGRGRPPKGRHLFRGGMLRCECGQSLVPRTNRNHEVYYCNGRNTLGRGFCDLSDLSRATIDTAVYRYFEQVGLDIDATRQTILEQRDRKLAEVRTLRHDADQEARRAEDRLARVRRDYTDGRLDADDWREFRTELTAELAAARAEADRLAAQHAHVQAWGESRDAEAETLRRLAEIRTLIAGEINDAAGVDAVRAALTRTFEHFTIRRWLPRVHVELIADPQIVIDPVVREQAVRGYSETMRPILHREPLHGVDNQQVGKPNPQLFGPIIVGHANERAVR